MGFLKDGEWKDRWDYNKGDGSFERWNAELSIQNSTTQPRHLGASARTALAGIGPHSKIGLAGIDFH